MAQNASCYYEACKEKIGYKMKKYITILFLSSQKNDLQIVKSPFKNTFLRSANSFYLLNNNCNIVFKKVLDDRAGAILHYSKDKTKFYTLVFNTGLVEFNIKTNSLKTIVSHESSNLMRNQIGVLFTKDEKYLFSWGDDKKLKLTNLKTLKNKEIYSIKKLDNFSMLLYDKYIIIKDGKKEIKISNDKIGI